MNGVNPGRFLEKFFQRLSPDLKYLFQKPMRPLKKFKLHSSDQKVYYENAKVGESHVAKMLPFLSKALGIPHLTNAQVRPTTIRKLKRAGIEDRTVMSLTGKVNVVVEFQEKNQKYFSNFLRFFF